ncbi:MAG: FAD-dependent oxidoreductase [Polyangiaceae bacterium]|nr:FAD-dependent oxidoreductase [Polyangiaceae bacterium]
MLGGHVRTLGGNVACPALPPRVRLDAGVIEFGSDRFPTFRAFMKGLGVPIEEMPGAGATCLHLPEGKHYHSPDALRAEHGPGLELLRDGLHLCRLAVRRRRFLQAIGRAAPSVVCESAIERYLRDDDFSTWIRALLMYAYSMPYEEVRRLSAAIAIPMLRAFLAPVRWARIPGGTSAYVDRVAQSLRRPPQLDARLRGVRRSAHGPHLIREDGHEELFDVVVIAVPPHRVLSLLLDASDDERAWFGAFEGGHVETLVHTDTALYEHRRLKWFSEFDLFELPSGGHGYNAYLNRLAGLPTDRAPHYSLAFQLDAEIDPAKIVHRQKHDVARYTDEALRTRDDLARRNGARSTWFAGAFLGDGLHEGAIRSAAAIADRLGGRSLPS